MIIIYTTCKNTEDAVRIGHQLLQQRLASGIHIWPAQSMRYRNGQLHNSLTAILLIKTIETKLQVIEDLISAHHGTEIPFVGAIEVRRFNHAYKEVMAATIK
jgi:uncharacterized protein involved in tolerance to divalent cations